jgi:hypothetical protein
MSSIDTMFTRHLLSQIVPDVREAGKKTMKDGWVWKAGRDHWEFHGPDDFYWHGNAGDAYEARYKGWSAWLEKDLPEETI